MNERERSGRGMRARLHGLIDSLAARASANGTSPDLATWLGVATAALASACMWLAFAEIRHLGASLLWLACIGLLLRALFSSLDGAIARRSGSSGPAGVVMAEAPDRLADALMLLGAGYGASAVIPWASDLGWLAAFLALASAYVRVLGVACGLPEHREGPMSRRQRTFWMALAALSAGVAMMAMGVAGAAWVLVSALSLSILGEAATIGIRLRGIVSQLEEA